MLRGAFIEDNKALVQSFVDDYVAGGELAEHKDDHTHAVVSEFLTVEKDVLDLSLKWISYDNLKIEQDSYTILRDALIEMGLSENPPAYADFVDASFIQ